MYSYLLEAAPKGVEAYEWFTFLGRKPVELTFRGKPELVSKGVRFGVRISRNRQNIRLIFEGDPNRVITVTPEQAQQLAKGVK